VDENDEIEILDDYNTNDNQSSNNNSNNKNKNSKYIMTFLLFFILIISVLFLPQISTFISDFTKKDNSYSDKKITSGILKCSMSKHSKVIDYDYDLEFSFDNNKLLSLSFISTIIGDDVNNKYELEDAKNKCLFVKEEVNDLSGVSISCSLKNGKFVQKQLFVYASFDPDQIKPLYGEASLIYPNFSKDENINDIERIMISSDYECKRYK